MAGKHIPIYCAIFLRERFKMTKAYFNEKADIWDEKVAEKNTSKLERMVGRLKIEVDSTILDVGTGTGVFLPYLLKKVGVHGEIIAIDNAEKMLFKAKLKKIGDNIIYLCADVMTIPLANDFCDSIVCYSSLPHFPDKSKAMMEMKRILKKGGWVFICHTSSREHINNIHRNLPSVHNDLLPDAIEMMDLLTKAGFSNIQVEDKADSYLACGRKP
jgi:ubiquinone/menaquinone biosynthesis C-methylase UbiE